LEGLLLRAKTAAWLAALGLVCAAAQASSQDLAQVLTMGLPEPLTAVPGDAQRGLAIVGSRQVGLCLLCHQGPLSADFAQPQLQGNLATDLHGVGSRWSAAQLRLRVVDSRRINPASLMPTMHGTADLQRVGSTWQGKPVLTAQQVEDVVAYLLTLK
jgi:L-cysteine S-thiosulfotransferase